MSINIVSHTANLLEDFSSCKLYIAMEFKLKTKCMEDIMRSIDKLCRGIDPQGLNRWAKTVETFAKKFCNDRLHNITLRRLDRELDLAVRDRKSADCLVRAIETNLP